MDYRLTLAEFSKYFKNNKEIIANENMKMLRFSFIFSSLFGLIVVILNKVFFMFSIKSYFLFISIVLLYYVFSLIIEKYHYKYFSLLLNGYIISLVSIISYWSNIPNNNYIGVYYLIALIAIPSLFLLSISNMLISLSISNIIFLLTSYLYKTSTAFLFDISFSIIASLIGLLLYFMVNILRIQGQTVNSFLLELSKKDELSNLPNRRHLNQYLEEASKFCLKNKLPIGIVMMDIDNFKIVNDISGHLFGDKVVRKFGSLLLNSSVENQIFFARYGGDEFVGVFLDFKQEEIISKMKSISEELKMMFNLADSESITLSIGISTSQDLSTCNYNDIINQADIALFKAKSKGKNCLEVYNLEESL